MGRSYPQSLFYTEEIAKVPIQSSWL